MYENIYDLQKNENFFYNFALFFARKLRTDEKNSSFLLFPSFCLDDAGTGKTAPF